MTISFMASCTHCHQWLLGKLVRSCLFVLILLGLSVPVRSQTETVLYSFGSYPTDGYGPAGGLLIDSSGNLFGTTSSGSDTQCDLGEVFGCGIVYEMVKSSNGYTDKVLYSFGSSSAIADGATPFAGLISDAAGNLYGTTTYGGSSNCLLDIGADGCGTVFELVKSSSGYTETVLYTFMGSDGANPFAGLTIDSRGNLYGTTDSGGDCSLGTVFELVNSSVGYTHKILHSFGCTSNDGSYPYGGLIMDSSGNLYGTAESAGDSTACGGFGCGIVFELVNSGGNYTESVLYSFTGADGQTPSGSLMFDSMGNLYGTTQEGGEYGNGTVFELVNSSGNYAEKVLYSFKGPGKDDGQTPEAGLLMDSSGNIYGTTRLGGVTCAPQGCGIVFELVNSSGAYTEKILHWFGATGDGEEPATQLVVDSAGNLYGTTDVGGDTNASGGTVFEVNPKAAAPSAILSPQSLTFGNQPFKVTSAPQSVTVMNIGSANLVFGSGAVSLSGDNSTDFTLGPNTCNGAAVAPGATCSLTVTFTPSMIGSESAVLTFADNASTSPQTVGILGSGVTAPAASVSPVSIAFTGQVVGATSGATVTVSNLGDANLTISSVAISGANAGDFALASSGTTCQANDTVTAGSTCVVNVTFTPTAGGARAATLTIIDNSYNQFNNSQSVTLSGSGQDFGVAASSGTASSTTVTPGATANYSLSVSPEGGFNQAVNLSCTGAPSEATCSISPNAVSLNGNSASAATVTVTTTAASVTPVFGWRTGGDHKLPIELDWAKIWLLISLLGLAVATSERNRGQETNSFLRLAMLAPILATVMLLASCGGGSSSGPPPNSGTPAGAYTLTITGTSGNLSHSATLTLAVD